MKVLRLSIGRSNPWMDVVDRDHGITRDEILNLRIALELSQDVSDLFVDEHLFSMRMR
jgi:hypothetical protein